ncbi:hypothetical protein ACJW31_01G355500 [Castanea mollissima]
MAYAPGATTKCQIYLDSNTLHEVTQCKITHVNSLINTSTCPSLLRNPCSNILPNSTFSWKGRNQLTNHHCRLHDSIPADDEYCSSRNIAINLFKRFKNAVERGGGDNLKSYNLVQITHLATCTRVRKKELNDMREYGVEIEAMQSYGRTTSLKSKIILEEVDECILWLSSIFITILCTPQPTIAPNYVKPPLVRWSSTPPMSNDVTAQWKGFCAVIANAYFERGMAWLPVKTLQLEQMAVVGRAEEPSVVASRMRLVFTTLKVVSPYWPKV